MPSARCDLTSADAQAHGDPFPMEQPLAGGLFLQRGITRDFSNKILGAGLAGSGTSISVVLATALASSYPDACLDSSAGFLPAPRSLLLLLVLKVARRGLPELLLLLHLHHHLSKSDAVQGRGTVQLVKPGPLIPNLATFSLMKALVAPVKHQRKCTCVGRLRISPGNYFLKNLLVA